MLSCITDALDCKIPAATAGQQTAQCTLFDWQGDSEGRFKRTAIPVHRKAVLPGKYAADANLKQVTLKTVAGGVVQTGVYGAWTSFISIQTQGVQRRALQARHYAPARRTGVAHIPSPASTAAVGTAQPTARP